MASYSLSNAWESARRRLALLEQHLDPITHRRLFGLGLGKAWHCLEVGGGGGSVARWLCAQVGADGRVVGTDIDPRFLEKLANSTLKRGSTISLWIPCRLANLTWCIFVGCCSIWPIQSLLSLA